MQILLSENGSKDCPFLRFNKSEDMPSNEKTTHLHFLAFKAKQLRLKSCRKEMPLSHIGEFETWINIV